MGEYWKPVNLDTKEEVHPHRVGDGLKLGEWYEWEGEPVDSKTRQRVAELIREGRWAAGNEVRIVSDYGGAIHFHGPQTDRIADYDDDWTDVSTS